MDYTVCDMLAESPFRIAYFLIPGFASMSFAAVSEPFRAANTLAGRELYRGRVLSLAAGPVEAAGGVSVLADEGLGAIDFDVVFVFVAGRPQLFDHAPTLAWLRRLAALGVTLGGISGGAWVLARAGLLERHRATIHWEHAVAFAQTFPRVALDPGLFVIDGSRLTGAGGASGFDLAAELISRAHGADLARAVRDWFIGAPPREGTGPQRPHALRFGAIDTRLASVLDALEAGLPSPPARDDLARAVGLGARQLERLCRRDLGITLAATLARMRLERADQLLRQTRQPVTGIAAACGYASTSHFSRAYRRWAGMTPGDRRRRQHSGPSMGSFHPECQ